MLACALQTRSSATPNKRSPRFTIAIVVGVTALIAAGCGSDNEATTKGTETSKTPSTTKATATTAPPLSVDFENTPAGKVPKGAEVFDGKWAVKPEKGAPSRPNVLCQSNDVEYAAIELSSKDYADVDVTADFKPISGQVDQAGGIIFRVQDGDNYYIVRANALEDNVALYIYKDGERSQIGDDGVVEVKNGAWQQLRLRARGDRFTAYFQGKKVLETDDSTLKAGGVGLWTKADSTTCFDGVKINS